MKNPIIRIVLAALAAGCAPTQAQRHAWVTGLKPHKADMKKMAADPEPQRWWKETGPCQSPLPDALKAGMIWADTKEIHHLE